MTGPGEHESTAMTDAGVKEVMSSFPRLAAPASGQLGDDALVARVLEAAEDRADSRGRLVGWWAVGAGVAAAAGLALLWRAGPGWYEGTNDAAHVQTAMTSRREPITGQADVAASRRVGTDEAAAQVEEPTAARSEEPRIHGPEKRTLPQVEPVRPPSAEELLERAQAERARGAIDDAVRTYETLVREHASTKEAAAARVSLGLIALDRGDPARALSHFDSHLEGQAPSLVAEATYGRIKALRALGRLDEARREALEFIATHPQSPYVARLREWVEG